MKTLTIDVILSKSKRGLNKKLNATPITYNY